MAEFQDFDRARPMPGDVVMWEAQPQSNRFLWGVVVGLYEWGVQIKRRMSNGPHRFTVEPEDNILLVLMRGKRRRVFRR